MAYVVNKKEDGIGRNQVVLDYQGIKREIALGLNEGTIKSVLEVERHSVVRDVIPKFHEGIMLIEREKDYTRSNSDVPAELYTLFVENSCSEEMFECLDTEKNLRSALTSHLSVGNSILSIFQISRTKKEYKELKVEINGFEMILK